MSWKHLHRYCNEFAYRHSAGPGNGFKTIGGVLDRMVGERLTYKRMASSWCQAPVSTGRNVPIAPAPRAKIVESPAAQ